MSDLYEILGVTRDDSPETIKAAYKAKSRAAHPDKGGSEEAFAAIAEAWEVLSDPEKRAHYDQTGEVLGAAPAFSAAESLYMSIFSECLIPDFDFDGIVQRVCDALDKKLSALIAERDAAEGAREMYRGELGRFHNLGEGENLVEVMLNNSINKLGQVIDDLEGAIEMHMDASEIAWDYEDGRPRPRPTTQALPAGGWHSNCPEIFKQWGGSAG